MTSAPVEYAGLGSRAIALIIDTILLVIVGGILVGMLFGAPGTSMLDTPNLVFLIISLGYFIVLEGTNDGQTLGKSLVNIRVVDDSGGDLEMEGAVIRNVLRIVDALPFLYIIGIILVVASDEEKRLGDMIGNSIVVKA